VPTPEIGSTLRAWCGKHNYSEKGDRDDWINRTLVKAYDFVTSRKEKSSANVTTFKDAAHAFIDTIERGDQIFIPSGIRELDDLVGGIEPGEVAIIAGRPSHGKSALGFQWVAHAASLGVKCLVISEEMGKLQIGKRRLMTISDIPGDQWVQASVSALRRDVDEFHKGHADIFVVESCGTIDRVEEVIDQFCELYNVGHVCIDYMQLLGARSTDRYEVVTEVSRRVKQCARRNNVPILNLSQLNRGIESRDGFEPKLSDLRESGQIEQDADKVFFTVYPSKFSDVDSDLYYIYCGKNRNGPGAGTKLETSFDGLRQRIGYMPNSVLDL
jgi:replicative DNA helicase